MAKWGDKNAERTAILLLCFCLANFGCNFAPIFRKTAFFLPHVAKFSVKRQLRFALNINLSIKKRALISSFFAILL